MEIEKITYSTEFFQQLQKLLHTSCQHYKEKPKFIIYAELRFNLGTHVS